ncbi:MAG: ATP-binding protein [Alphaproteobacteria bacterium]|nr:ATP-binding protein [Alphaproteobacteria bacterium]
MRSSSTLIREYLIFSGILVFIVATICLLFSWKLYQSIEEARDHLLVSYEEAISENLRHSFDKIANHHRFLGEKARLLIDQNKSDLIPVLLQGEGKVDSGLRSIYAWMSTQWERGACNDSPPWQLNVSALHSNHANYLPVYMFIDSDNGCIGRISSKLYIDQLDFSLAEVSQRYEKLSFMLFDSNGNFLVASNPSVMATDIVKTDLAVPVQLGDTQYIKSTTTSNGLQIMVGYKQADWVSSINAAIGTSVLLGACLTGIYLVLLFLFRRHTIVPLIDRLYKEKAREVENRMESQRLLRSITDKMPGFVYQYKMRSSQNHQITLLTRGSDAIFGNESRGTKDILHWQLTDSQEVINLQDDIMQHRLHENDSYNVTFPLVVDGKVKWLFDQGIYLSGNKEEKTIEGVVIDITDIKEAEEQLKQALAKLRQSNEELEKFSFIFSHDLKEPLRVISIFSQMLERHLEMRGIDDDEVKIINQHIMQGVDRAKEIIENILDYYVSSHEELKIVEVSVEQLVKELIPFFSNIDESKQVNFNIESLPVICADKKLLKNVLQNIISNSVKFCDKKYCQITISAESSDTDITFAIKDNGIGIPKKYHNSIFDLFKRLNRKDEYEGTGVGLALCKRVIEAHGGQIWVKSDVGQGTTFYIKLPKIMPQ